MARRAIMNGRGTAHDGARAGADDIYQDEVARQRARRYSHIRQWLVLVDLLWTGLMSAAVLATGLSARLRDRAAQLAPRRLGPAMPYAFAATVLSSLVSLPLSYLEGFVLERRYGLTNQTPWSWLGDHLKRIAVTLVLGVPLTQGIYWIIQRYPRRWWAVLSSLSVPFTILLSNLAPVLILPLFNKFEPLKDRALADRIKGLAETQGVHVSDVLQMDMSRQTKKANAFFTGIGHTKRIVLGDTLLGEFTPDEVEVVLAHELGHQVHRDLWKLIGFGTAATFVTSYAVHRLATPLLARVGPRFDLDPEQGAADVAAMPALGLLLGSVSLALAPLRNAWSRRLVEHAADRYALDLTRNPAAFVSAMEKLGRMNLADPSPAALVKYLLYSHPPLQERIDFGRSYAAAPAKQARAE